ncbi:MAG: DUF2807 domain-containing protein [Prevotellaceae bacterium]|nr:DUF2807 domain-containing protein [Prevotellaceae bacterium]
MKKMMILVSAIAMSLAANAESTDLTPFEGVNVNVPACVRFVYGEEYSMDVQATDSLVASAIRWTVKDGVLKIHSVDSSESISDVCITIVSPQEPKLTVGRNMEMRPTRRMRKNHEQKES